MDAPIAGPSTVSPRVSPVALSKRTSSKNAIRDTFSDVGSPEPTTPPRNRRRTKLKDREREREGRKGKGKQPMKSRGSVEDDSHRHSHGLSWHSTTRDSVVDNLLFSLDNLSKPNLDDDNDVILDSDFDRQKYMFPSYSSMPMSRPTGTQRPRGHTYSSSMSSTNDRNFIADSPSSYATSTPQGRRSNSSSDFGIKSSISGMMRGSSIKGKNADSQKFSRTHTLTNGHHTRDGSFGHSAASHQGRLRWGRRSMSMDQMYAESIATGASMIHRGRPVPSVHSKFDRDDADVAPEPTVAGGPRKKDNPTATGPVYVNQAPSRTSLRKTTTQTDLRSANKPLQSPPIPLDVRNQANEFVRANSMRGPPALDKPLPSPALHSPPLKSPPPRPGFFKRVFGGSSRTNSDTLDRANSADDKELPAPPARTSSSNGAQSRTGTRQASKEHPSGTTYPPPSLHKKPSSFFRRRKKSTSEINAPPPLPLGVDNLRAQAAEPSPSVSSLRKVLDPYLVDEKVHPDTLPIPKHDETSRPTTQESSEDSDNLDIFHSGYTPPPDASLGKRDPLSRSPSAKHSVEQQKDSPQTKLKVKKRKPEPLPSTSGQIPSDRNTLSPLSPRFRGIYGRHGSSPVESAKVSPITTEMPIDNKENQRPVSRASTGDRIIAQSREIVPEEQRKPSVVSSVGSEKAGDSWIRTSMQDRPESKKSEWLYLKPTPSDDALQPPSPDLSTLMEASNDGSAPASAKSPAFQTATSTTFPAGVHSPITPSTRYHSATSLPLFSVQLENEREKSLEAILPSPIVDEGAEYRERGRKIYEGDEEDVAKAEAASWLGEKNTLSTRTLQAFMHLFEFSGLNVLSALRVLCGKLVLKGETQQFDRIIMAFSTRWCECNPNHGFKAQDVVHTICYSLILLNTDLHLADIAERMSRSAYVKNTLPTIRRVVSDAAPNAFDDTVKPAPNNFRPALPWTDSQNSVQTLSPIEQAFEQVTPGLSKRLSIRPPTERQNSDTGTPDSAGVAAASNALVNQPWTGPIKAWEFEIEAILKSFYASIRIEPLPLMGQPLVSELPSAERNLSVANLGGLKRSNSIVSKAQSDAAASFRGLRNMTMGFQSKYNRSRPKVYPSSTISSRTSFDGDSVWSPVQSSTWSKNSFSRTLTSASMQSLGQHLTPITGDFKHSIGFANALSQAIIREENDFAQAAADNQSASLSVPRGLLEDEALALEGAPWAKEGLVKHKHHLETSGKKYKERTWNEAFAVISKGKLTLFAFNKSTKSMSMGRKAHTKAQTNGRAASAAAPRVGGGDWMENAEQLDVFVLRQTIASTLPPPGYSKTRPHVWALSLPSGAVHLFQVGTPEIAREFMSTANYWSARLSKEPLSGGVSNIEYGWSDQVINTALLEPRQGAMSPNPPPSLQNRPMHSHTNSAGGMGRSSLQSSIRTSLDTGFGSRPRLPGDKVMLAEWHPPSQSMMASQLMEVDQLKALVAYVGNVEAELARHNELKQGIELAVSKLSSTLACWCVVADFGVIVVFPPPHELQPRARQLAAQIRLPPPRNRQVPDVCRFAGGSAEGEGGVLFEEESARNLAEAS